MNLFIIYRWAKGRTNDCPENFPKIISLRLWNGPEPGTMLGKSNELGPLITGSQTTADNQICHDDVAA